MSDRQRPTTISPMSDYWAFLDWLELKNIKLEARIANLEAENARLRDVLEKIADGQDGTGWRIQSTGYAENVQRLAREALTRDDFIEVEREVRDE